MTQAIMMTLLSAGLASVGGFTTGAALRTRDARRENRVTIFHDCVPACRNAITNYAAGVREEGPIASLAVDEVIACLEGTYRVAMVASRQDEAHARALACAARDLSRARHRHDVEGLPRRAREGGWAQLAIDTMSQAEVALLDYEAWLGRRLLGPRLLRQATRYQSIEIDRDLDGEDPSRSARPTVLTSDVLRNLLGMPIVSWAVLMGVPVEERVLVIWMHEPDQRVMQRLIETDDDWLYPIGNVPDPAFPRLWRIASRLHTAVTVPVERQAESSTMVIADYPVPPAAQAELVSRQVPIDDRHPR